MSAIIGLDGLSPTLNIIKHTKIIAIANKESIICGWNLLAKELKKYKKGDLAVSEEIYNKILWLPSGNNLDENQLEYICNTISNY